MKTLMAALTLFLSASAAMAEAPCQNPVAPACQKACAAMGAKYVLSMRQQNLQSHMPVRAIRVGNSEDNAGSLENAERLVHLAGLSRDYIDGLTAREIGGAIAAYCPR